MSLWFPKLSDSVSFSIKWLKVVRIAVGINWLSKSSAHRDVVWLRNCPEGLGQLGILAAEGATPAVFEDGWSCAEHLL